MKIIGIDPGLSATGYGVIETDTRNNVCLTFGAIKAASNATFTDKLLFIHREISKAISQYHPEFCAIENIFYHQNKRTAIIMGHARAVAMLAAAELKVPVFEYTPREVKMSIVGIGDASKSQVQAMVKNILHMQEIPHPNDAADALAVALCHHHRLKFQQMTQLV